jgi:hypothetical protein
VNYDELMKALKSKSALPKMSQSLGAEPLPLDRPMTSIDPQQRKHMVQVVNGHVIRLQLDRDVHTTYQSRLALAAGRHLAALPLGSADDATMQQLRVLARAAGAVADARNVLVRCLIVEYYSPFLTCVIDLGKIGLGRRNRPVTGEAGMRLFVFWSRELLRATDVLREAIEPGIKRQPLDFFRLEELTLALTARVRGLLQSCGRAFAPNPATPFVPAGESPSVPTSFDGRPDAFRPGAGFGGPVFPAQAGAGPAFAAQPAFVFPPPPFNFGPRVAPKF